MAMAIVEQELTQFQYLQFLEVPPFTPSLHYQVLLQHQMEASSYSTQMITHKSDPIK